jgi:glutaredoxin-related protein
MGRKRFLALINYDVEDQVEEQKEAMALLKGVRVESELVDCTEADESEMRDKLFETSGITDKYPQFFVIDPQGNRSYFGGYDKIKEMSDEGTLSRAALGLGPADPDGNVSASQRVLHVDESSADEEEDSDSSEEESGDDSEEESSDSSDEEDDDEAEESLATKNTDRSKPASMISADPKKQGAMSAIMEEEEDLPCCCCVPFSVVGLVSYLLRLDEPYEIAPAPRRDGGTKVGVATEDEDVKHEEE